MSIRLHIECLVLDGLALDRRDGSKVQMAVERDLSRLLCANGISSELRSGGAVPHISTNTIGLVDKTHPTRLGHQIAQSINSGIGGLK